MPKRGGGGGRGRWNNGGDGNRGYNNYNEHDTRGHENTVRRVSFKPNSNKINKSKHRNWDSAIKNLNDDDIDMGGMHPAAGRNNNFRGNFRGRGRREGRVNSPAPRQNNPHRKLLPGPSSWYQVTIPWGQKYEKNFILTSLLNILSPDIFVPQYYTVHGNAVIFYVDDFGMAEKLNNTDKKIHMPDGFKLSVRVKPGIPQVNIDSTLLEKMKIAMGSRYNPATKALDLTKFHADPNLIDVFCALFRPSIMLAAIDIIAENIPDIQALNLNENKLQVLDHLKTLLKKLPNLRILYLANNRIPHISSLEALRGLPLVELFLEGNPLADRFKEKDVYVREVQKRFPKVLKLDGAELPPVIGFDVSEDLSLPPSRASFLCNMEGQVIVRQFLEQYFALYDSDSRQPLLDAYHEYAMFSMSAYYRHTQTQNNSNRLNKYLPNCRNLLRNQDQENKKALKIGRLQVVSFLNDLPKTLHDPLSFSVDLTIFTPALLMLTVSGVFKELSSPAGSAGSSPPPIRSFHKSMVIVPHGGGFCIRNDTLYITNSTPEQEKECFRTPDVVAEVVQPPPYVHPAIPPAVVPLLPNVVPAMENHQQLIQAVASQTNMNIQWSTNCLEQTNWDYQRAILVFANLHKEGKIPPEAFIK